MLIAGREQIDSKEEFFDGYVNNWSTDEFSKYVLNKDKRGLFIWLEITSGLGKIQENKKCDLGLRSAMQSAKIIC